VLVEIAADVSLSPPSLKRTIVDDRRPHDVCGSTVSTWGSSALGRARSGSTLRDESGVEAHAEWDAGFAPRDARSRPGRGPLLRINVVLPGFQKRRRKLRDSRRTEDGHVRRVRDDREAVWRSQRSVEAGVALSAAQQFVELHDVFRANAVGIRKHEQSRRLDVGHGARPIVASIGELTSLPEHSFPVHGRIK